MGLVLMSVITAQVSSSITADEMQRLDEVFGDKVQYDRFIFFSQWHRHTRKTKIDFSQQELNL